MSKQAFDRKLEALESLRSSPGSLATAEQLRKALKDRSNFLVAKAAKLTAEFGLQALISELLAAFDRFMESAAKSDPQCWAKNAIVKALKDLGHDDPAVYLRGIVHIQLEGTWGGHKDSAAALRGACALAIAASHLDRVEILTRLVDALADPEKEVRVDAARAIAQLPGSDSGLLLRLKALTGDAEPEVIGQCFACLLDVAPKEYVPFMARFLDSKNADLQLEAISALGECRDPEAVDLLKRFWKRLADPEAKRAVLLSLAPSPHSSAMEFLLTVLENERPEHALDAAKALASSRFRDEARERAQSVIAQRGDLEFEW